MTTFLFVLWLITAAALGVLYLLKQRAEAGAKTTRERAETARRDSDHAIALAREETERAVSRARGESLAAVAYAEQTLERKLAELSDESERIREHYEREAQRVYKSAKLQLETTLAEVAQLRDYASLKDAENEVTKKLAEAMVEAAALRREAQALVDQTRTATNEERAAAHQRAKDIHAQSEALLVQATRDAGRIADAAERRAEQIGGDAYVALRDKQVLDQTVGALWNVVEGYGDKYVTPTRSILDEFAANYSHTNAGEELRAAREQSRRLVELKLAASCNYEETDRRERANRFIVDAFNGRVDAILSRTKNDNYGTLEREIRDAFSVVNLNGLVFRDARILPAYLDARLAELKWAVVTQELRLKEREEQREIQERIREEEKARREYERAIQEAAREEAAIKQAIAKARAETEHASAEEREKYEVMMADLNERLADAEARGQRALSMAQQTRAGNVYVISNVGSFGEDVVKIGMTRRLIPEDRIKELGGASVPFEFDVHAMIKSDDAPALEHKLHQVFDEARINKVNYRKEFFRVPLERLRLFAAENGLEVTFTMAALARDYRETLALEKMIPADRAKYQARQTVEGGSLAEDRADLPE